MAAWSWPCRLPMPLVRHRSPIGCAPAAARGWPAGRREGERPRDSRRPRRRGGGLAGQGAAAAGRGGGVVLCDVRSQPPLTLRRSGGRVLVVGSAAGPVGGDELDLRLEVAPGARVSIGPVAATIVWPGPDGRSSTASLTIDVGARAHVDWHPCPTVSVA